MGSALSCSCIPKKICGKDTDALFAFSAKKAVKIEDRTLGILNYLLMLMIFVFIVIFQMWFKGMHFKEARPQGFNRIQWQQPTNKCNPKNVDCLDAYTSASQLPYCLQYQGKETYGHKEVCEFEDAKELPIIMPAGVLMPTFVQKYKQMDVCPYGAADCERKWAYVDENDNPQQGSGEAKPMESFYVADVDDFTVLIDHGFSIPTGDTACNDRTSCNDFDMPGFYYVHGEKTAHDITCKHKYCDALHEERGWISKDQISLVDSGFNSSSNHTADRTHKLRAGKANFGMQPHLGVHSDDDVVFMEDSSTADDDRVESTFHPFSNADGDIFALSKLFAMAGLTVDSATETVEKDPIRLRGTVLVVEIDYTNKRPWTLFTVPGFPLYNPWKIANPWYTIRVSKRRTPDFKHYYVLDGTDPKYRTLVVAYGTMIIIQQSGTIAVWNTASLFAWLGGAAGLIMASATIMNFLATSVMAKKEAYTEALIDDYTPAELDALMEKLQKQKLENAKASDQGK